MRTIIAGSRTCTDMQYLLEAIAHFDFDITVVIGGEAPGVDTLGKEWALAHHIPYEGYPANWGKYGKKAGYHRNRQMRDEGKADALIALWDGVSPGTKNMIQLAYEGGLIVYVHTIPESPRKPNTKHFRVKDLKYGKTF